jgi:chaperonin GroEL (HSP60 family)
MLGGSLARWTVGDVTKVVAVMAPGFGNHRKSMLEDIAVWAARTEGDTDGLWKMDRCRAYPSKSSPCSSRIRQRDLNHLKPAAGGQLR